eukprot:c9823_g2_i1.p1 GENE.c9823_g2_i1~~c9823_g2_i1.p1  ORF type:complete len:336 (-),score=109.29 c9823_g2_i1:185-1087(-)
MAFQQAHSLKPHLLDARINEAVQLVHLHKVEEADTKLKGIRDEDVGHVDALTNLSALLLANHQGDEATRLLEFHMQVNDVKFVFGDAASVPSPPSTPTKTPRDTRESGGDDVDASILNNMSCCAIPLTTALRHLHQAHEQQPTFVPVAMNLAYAHLQAASSGSAQQQKEHCRIALSVVERAFAPNSELSPEQKLCKCLVFLQHALMLQTSRDDASVSRALHFELRAIDLLTSVIDHNPTLPGPWLLLGWVRLLQDKFDEALEYFQNAITRDPRNALAWSNLSLAIYLVNITTTPHNRTQH